MKCQNCNHSIKRAYTWNGQTLGIECWKKIALPEIECQRQERWAAIQRQEWVKSYGIVYAIKQKDFSKIKSDLKIKFLNSLVEQFEEKGFISKKQRQMVWGVGSQWGGMFNDRDSVNEIIGMFLVGDEPTKYHCIYLIETLYNQDKHKDYFNQAVLA